MLTIRATLAAAALTAVASAQVTTASLTVGGNGGLDCQAGGMPAALTGGVPASAQLDFTYDQATGVLDLAVTNTSPITAGVPNPLITRIGFNLPQGAITGAQLVSQSAAGGATPAFAFTYGATKMACFGDFGAHLGIRNIQGGIGNEDADTYSIPAAKVVVGPAAFSLQLSGPGSSLINASTIAAGFSTNAPQASVNGTVKFQGGGVGDESGFVSTDTTSCTPSVWTSGEAVIGTQIEFCASAAQGCAGCVFVSQTPGPTTVLGMSVPIGLPILHAIVLGPMPNSGPLCLPTPVPNDPTLVGETLYFSFGVSAPNSAIEFSPAFSISFVGPTIAAPIR